MVAETTAQVEELKLKHQMEADLGVNTEFVTGYEARA